MLREFWSWETTANVLQVTEPTAIHELLLFVTMCILFTAGPLIILALVLAQLVVSIPFVIVSSIVDVMFCEAQPPMEYLRNLLDGYAFPDLESIDEHGPFYPGYRWILILPLAGGTAAVATSATHRRCRRRCQRRCRRRRQRRCQRHHERH